MENYRAQKLDLLKCGQSRAHQLRDEVNAHHPAPAPDQSAMISALTNLGELLNQKYNCELEIGDEKEEPRLRKA